MNKLPGLHLFKSADPYEIISGLNNLIINELSDKELECLCGLIEHSDKGVQSAVTFLLIDNPDERAAGYLVNYISSEKINLRNLAGDLLIRMGIKSTPGLLKYLSSIQKDDDIKFVIDILGLIEDQRASDKIISVLSSAENENVIIACIEALGNLKCEDAGDYLLMAYDKNYLFKMYVIDALGKIGTPQSLEFLNQKYLSEDDYIKFSIIENLSKIGDEETFFFLLAELNQSQGPIVWPLIEAIYKLKQKFGFDIPFDEKMKNAVVHTIYAADNHYKKVAVRMVTIFEDREINNACLKIYGEETELDEIIKQKFFEYRKENLLDITSLINEKPSNLQSLLFLLQEVLEVYDASRIVISNLEYRNLIDSITKSLENPDEEVRKTAMNIMFSIDSNIALMFMDAMVEDNNIWNRLHLLDLLTRLNYEKIKDVLLLLAADENEMVAERSRSLLQENTQNELNQK